MTFFVHNRSQLCHNLRILSPSPTQGTNKLCLDQRDATKVNLDPFFAIQFPLSHKSVIREFFRHNRLRS